jgi:hypothetical protein
MRYKADFKDAVLAAKPALQQKINITSHSASYVLVYAPNDNIIGITESL